MSGGAAQPRGSETRDQDRAALLERQREVVRRSEELCRRARLLSAVSAAEVRTGQLSRRQRRPSTGPVVRLWGRLEDDTPVQARVGPGVLTCEPALWTRAQVVVAAGELVAGDGTVPEPATLEGPPAVVLLTLVRACARVDRLELEV